VGLGAYLYMGQDLVLGLLCVSFVPFAVWRCTVFRLRCGLNATSKPTELSRKQ
jgi:hypothetical protein